MKAVILETKRLKLEKLTLNHLTHDYVSWLNDEDIYRYLESGGNYTFKQLELYLKEQEDKDILFWAIHLKSTKKHIGNIKIDPLDAVKNSGEYGIMMGDRTEWGKGYAQEASLRILKYCFEKVKLSQVTLGVVEDNINALKLYKKLGFKVYKIIENKGVYNDKMCNSIRMIKTND